LPGSWSVIEIIRPDGFVAHDVRPLVRLNVQLVVEQNGRKETGYHGLGGRYLYDRLFEPATWHRAIDIALAQGLVNLESVAAPAGEMTVVLGSGWPGVLLHEAIGHRSRGDFNRKGHVGLFRPARRAGRRPGRDGGRRRLDRRAPRLALDRRRGHADPVHDADRGRHPVGYHPGSPQRAADGRRADRQRPARELCPCADAAHDQHLHAGRQRTIRARFSPAPRTASTPRASAAGQVDITSGKFVFSCTEAYRIENGRLGPPIKGATLIGDGPTVLTKVAAIGNDMALDEGIGVCGKGGQSVPAGVGQPTLLIQGLTVGGTAA
jgi:TldD protein